MNRPPPSQQRSAPQVSRPATRTTPSKAADHRAMSDQSAAFVRSAGPAEISRPGRSAVRVLSALLQKAVRALRAPAMKRGAQVAKSKRPVVAGTFFGVGATGQHIAFILDVSGSMAWNGRWETCTRQLEGMLRNLPSTAHFFVVLYSTSMLEPPGQQEWEPAHGERIEAVLQWIASIAPDGGTVPGPAFERVFSLAVRPTTIYFLTDGQFAGFSTADCARLQRLGATSRDGDLLSRSFAPQAREAVINTITLDDDSSAPILRDIAAESSGQYVHATSD
jgi:hypothetical protein